MTATGHAVRDCAPYTIATLGRLRALLTEAMTRETMMPEMARGRR